MSQPVQPQTDRHRASAGSIVLFREFVRIGVYRGNVVAVKRINKKSVDLNRTILKELNSVKISRLLMYISIRYLLG